MRRRCVPLPVLALCGCAQDPLAEISLPQLCPRTSTGQEVTQMANLIRGHRRSAVIAHFGAPARRSLDSERATEKLVWGPLAISYRRDNGQTVPMNCEVEMYAGTDGAISRVIWSLTPADLNGQGAR